MYKGYYAFNKLFPPKMHLVSFYSNAQSGLNQGVKLRRVLSVGLTQTVPGFLTLPTAYVTGNPVECVVHPDLWNKTSLWDPLGIGRVRVDSLERQDNSLDDEFVEENYGAPINTVSHSVNASEIHCLLLPLP